MDHRVTRNLCNGLLVASLVAVASVSAGLRPSTHAFAADVAPALTSAQNAFADNCDKDEKKDDKDCKDKADKDKAAKDKADKDKGDKDKADKDKVGATNGGHGSKGEKVTICHATGSASNPFVTITISKNGLNGHGDHERDITPVPAGGCPSGSVGISNTAPLTKEIRGIEFVVYIVNMNDKTFTILLLQALPQDMIVWQTGNQLFTAPAGSVSTSDQNALAQELGPSSTVAQLTTNVLGQQALPAATGSAGLSDERSATTGAAWLLLPVLLLGLAAVRMAPRKQ